MSERNRKKPLYTGDPNATTTICPKKMRRHHSGDFGYVLQPRVNADATPSTDTSESAETQDQRPAMTVYIFCRHCKQDPFIPKSKD